MFQAFEACFRFLLLFSQILLQIVALLGRIRVFLNGSGTNQHQPRAPRNSPELPGTPWGTRIVILSECLGRSAHPGRPGTPRNLGLPGTPRNCPPGTPRNSLGRTHGDFERMFGAMCTSGPPRNSPELGSPRNSPELLGAQRQKKETHPARLARANKTQHNQ